MRTFAAERIETFALMDDMFEPRPLPVEPFGDSLGVNTGTPETIVIEFEPSTAHYIRAREWHRSQAIKETTDGGLVLTLHVCNDHPLHAWSSASAPARASSHLPLSCSRSSSPSTPPAGAT